MIGRVGRVLLVAVWLAGSAFLLPGLSRATDGECRFYESAGTRVVAGGVFGTVTTLLATSWTSAPAGNYSVSAFWVFGTAGGGTTRVIQEGSVLDEVGSASSGARTIFGAFSFAGGDLDVVLQHVSEGGNVTYGSSNDDPRWARRVVVCFMGTGGAGGSGEPGPTGPPGATGPPCASEGSPCPVEIIEVSGQALDVAQLITFSVAFIGGLVVLALAWLGIQGLRH